MVIYTGEPGDPGPPGLSISDSGVVYVAWGQTECPSTAGTELLLHGLAAAALRSNMGSGANYLWAVSASYSEF